MGLPSVPLGLAPEDALMAVASHMGIVRQKASADVMAPSHTNRQKAKASMTVAQVSPLGIAFRVRAVGGRGKRGDVGGEGGQKAKASMTVAQVSPLGIAFLG